MKNIIKEHKKAIVLILGIIIIYTLNSMYLYNKVDEANARTIEAQKPSYAEFQKELIDILYKERLESINNIQLLKRSIIEEENEKYRSEHMIRCEKINMFSEIKDNCSENWENYPKK